MIYVSSKIKHVRMWRILRDIQGFRISSSWIDEGQLDGADVYRGLWSKIELEIDQCKALVAYVEADDQPLRGVLIEIGMALAKGKPVYLVATMFSEEQDLRKFLGSWIYHPGVTLVESDVDHACWLAQQG